MSTVEHEAQSHHLPREAVARQQRRAVLFFILADAVFFASMLFTYFYLRSLNVENAWLPKDASTASSSTVWLITAVIVASALFYRWGEMAIRSGNRPRFIAGTLFALVLVVVALVISGYFTTTWPINMSDGSYASTFIVMTSVQIVHLLILLPLAIGIWTRSGQGKFDDGNYNHVTLVGYFWYWVALTAVLGAVTTFYVAV